MRDHESAQSRANLDAKVQAILTASDGGVSPTGLKQAYACQRSYLLGTTLQVYQREDNVHFQFGNAYGAGCAEIAQLYSQDKELALAKGVVAALTYMPLDASFKGKSWISLLAQLKAFCDVWATYLAEGWEFVATEHKLKIITPSLKLNGTFDLKVRNKLTGKYRIIDLKTTGSDFYYNWSTEQQVLFYTLLQYIYNEVGGYREVFEAGEYLVATVNEEGLSVKTVQLDYAVCVDMLDSMLSESARLYENVQAFATTCASRGFTEAVRKMPMNPASCVRGNFRCSYEMICLGGAPAYVGDVPDSRRPARIVDVKTSMPTVRNALDRLRQDLLDQIPKMIAEDFGNDLEDYSFD